MSTSAIYDAVFNIVKDRAGKGKLCLLDIGAGRGELLKKLSSGLDVMPYACDYHVERFELSVPIEKVNLNKDTLPYKDCTFDVVTCSEVIEHVENFHSMLREANRVLKKGGLFVVTTPNVLNMKSRLRFFVSGFFNLFGPLPVKNEKLYSTGGHITPVPYFYLAHALTDMDFSGIGLDIDRYQRTSLFILLLALPVLLPGWIYFLRTERGKYKTMGPENEPMVKRNFSLSLLAGRTIIVSAVKARQGGPSPPFAGASS
ncbi:MAG: class I SAM-dependent methyltransferase [Deltaproteobacteria bacterium]|nr:class I SAM-dependent methyltransferase [Deltaproteobacteria bacterium]